MRRLFFSLWDATSGKEVKSFPVPQDPGTPWVQNGTAAQGLFFLPSGKSVLVVGFFKNILRLEVTSGKKIWDARTEYGEIRAFAVSGNGKMAATFSGASRSFPEECSLQLWDTETGKSVRKLRLPQRESKDE
jgi:hypothetical protein